MITLCRMRGGSHAYGLNTPTSDEDIRGVFLDETPASIVGLDRLEQVVKQDLNPNVEKKDKEDVVMYELRDFLSKLRKTNTQCIEILYNLAWITLSHEFALLQKNREKLVDSERLFHSLRGYVNGEMRLAMGERPGKVGFLRANDIVKYGFSPRNFTHLYRLTFCALWFFRTGVYPVNIIAVDREFGESLLKIKTNPASFKKEDLRELAMIADKSLEEAYNDRVVDLKFDANWANEFILRAYYPVLQKHYDKLSLKQ